MEKFLRYTSLVLLGLLLCGLLAACTYYIGRQLLPTDGAPPATQAPPPYVEPTAGATPSAPAPSGDCARQESMGLQWDGRTSLGGVNEPCWLVVEWWVRGPGDHNENCGQFAIAPGRVFYTQEDRLEGTVWYLPTSEDPSQTQLGIRNARIRTNDADGHAFDCGVEVPAPGNWGP